LCYSRYAKNQRNGGDDMRQALKAQLLTELPQLTAVYAYGESVLPGSEPYAVVVQGEERFENAWTGYRRTFEVWLYGDSGGTSADTGDGLAVQAVQALNQRLLPLAGGGAFSCLYEGAIGENTEEPPVSPSAVKLRFSVKGLRHEAKAEAGAETEVVEEGMPTGTDPWLATLGAWSLNLLGPGWNSYGGRWPMDYRRPSILWRVTRMESKALSYGATEVTCHFAGHVLGTDAWQEHEAVLRLLSGLAAVGKLPFTGKADARSVGEAAGQPAHLLTVVGSPVADMESDAFGTGQLSLVLRCKTAVTAEEKPLVGKVNFTMG
jgi:hypothetical protein